MDVRYDGKVALVTGASKGIGKAVAAELVASGASVMLSSRKADALEAAAAEIGGDVAWFAANAGEPEAAASCVAATLERFGRIDVLVNNAATNPYAGPTIDIDVPRFDKTVQVNQRGPLVWSQQVWTRWMAEHGGVILNVASIGALSVEPTIGIYNGTKAALVHLTKQLGAELAPGVRVNAVLPGLVKTDMARALWERGEEAIAAHVPLRRLGEVDDIAKAAAFLCSDAASWITGTTLVVDGGMVL
ncbi:SDR family oxidoreductase [Aquihabitans sp. G128]|uniref:SDR family oxidoreductase n=1 Tax=Aquihabitans sp. G128 TaxID=2849779 RepID=UPI001C241A30|nr:SDR family oxidoreductase [Aquihabitans sp. G128]QXC62172.1 SDR family oxidoreductase [Aquihabitans sp. G128]